MVAQLAAELDLVCVAEGIETGAQAQFLRDLGVLGQGFAVGHPLPYEEVVTWLTPASWLAADTAWEVAPAQRGG
jgi:sensor c-di-GMP phosphodiesterase-like protein